MNQPQPIPTRVTVVHEAPAAPTFTVEYFAGEWKPEPVPYAQLVQAVERAKGISIGVYEAGKHDGRAVAWAGWV